MNEDILSDALDALQQGNSVDEVLERSPADAEELRPFLDLTHQLRSLEAPEMPARWKAAEAGFLQAAAARRAAARQASRAERRHRFVTLLGSFFRHPLPVGLAFTLLFLILGVGTITVSADASPGTPLYPIKRANEWVQLALTTEPERAALTMEFAERRRREIEHLLAAGNIVPTSIVLDLMEQIEDAARLLDRSPQADAEDWQALATLARQAAETLEQVERTESTDPAVVEEAFQSVSGTEERARAVAGNGESPQPTATPQPAAAPPEPTPTPVREEARPPEPARQAPNRNEAAPSPGQGKEHPRTAPPPADDRPPAASPGRKNQEAKPTPADAPRENQQPPPGAPAGGNKPPDAPPGRQTEKPRAGSEPPGPGQGRPATPPGRGAPPSSPPGQEKEKTGPDGGPRDNSSQQNNGGGPPGNGSGNSKQGPKKP